jgi:glycosyltransferase involved in cell wall biosynthesis
MSQNGEQQEPRLRMAVLWAGMSGFVHAQLRALVDRGVEVVLFHSIGSVNAPFEPDLVTRGLQAHAWSGSPNEAELEKVLDEFDPDVILIMSWDNGAYRRIGRRWRGRALRILCMDNQWWGTRKQWAGVAVSRLVIQPAYDAAFVAGDRQADFARRLGFPTERIIPGVYTGDYDRFAEVAASRHGELPPRAFLYVGRLVTDKGIDTLVTGYRLYRSRTAMPWPLLVAGTGPEGHLLHGIDGVEVLGFVQPTDLPEVFRRAGCFVLPSRFEPWGVVVHEATAAALPVVSTWVAGSALRLVLDGYNGVVMSPDDPEAVASALERIGSASDGERRAMGEASSLLARQYSPARWADSLLSRLRTLWADPGLAPTAPWFASRSGVSGEGDLAEHRGPMAREPAADGSG